jgi:ABC-type polysaccharide/polyol phosphate transport system ATPase subunit
VASVKLDQVSVDFPLYDVGTRSLRNLMLARGTGSRVNSDGDGVVRVKALRDISFELLDGDRLGLIGRNGAGKSTLLRAIGGIYEPPQGTVTITGNLASLLDLGLGIDPEMTGRENVLMRGIVLGMSRSDVRRKMEDIEQFAELGDSFDLPVRTYSSGMLVRLAFAISTSIEPEILLIDEVISAGDHLFMKKAEQRLKELTTATKILIVASHSVDVIRDFCNKCCLLRDGRLVKLGPVDEVVEEYMGPEATRS